LAQATVDRHNRLISGMLTALGTDTAQYNAASVRKVILDQIRGCRAADARTKVGAVRVYLRFLATNGVCQPGLDHALPTVAEWKLSSVPRYLDAKQAGQLIGSCDRNGPQGLRDRAIVLLLIRLGLRAGDIASLRPGDIDWQDASLLVRGKGRRDVRLGMRRHHHVLPERCDPAAARQIVSPVGAILTGRIPARAESLSGLSPSCSLLGQEPG
jgi:site-specific recombinase XerC